MDLIQHEVVEHVADQMHARPSAVNRYRDGRPSLLDRWGIRENELSLRGMVFDEGFMETAQTIALQTPDVRSVRNEMVVLPESYIGG